MPGHPFSVSFVHDDRKFAARAFYYLRICYTVKKKGVNQYAVFSGDIRNFRLGA